VGSWGIPADNKIKGVPMLEAARRPGGLTLARPCNPFPPFVCVRAGGWRWRLRRARPSGASPKLPGSQPWGNGPGTN